VGEGGPNRRLSRREGAAALRSDTARGRDIFPQGSTLGERICRACHAQAAEDGTIVLRPVFGNERWTRFAGDRPETEVIIAQSITPLTPRETQLPPGAPATFRTYSRCTDRKAQGTGDGTIAYANQFKIGEDAICATTPMSRPFCWLRIATVLAAQNARTLCQRHVGQPIKSTSSIFTLCSNPPTPPEELVEGSGWAATTDGDDDVAVLPCHRVLAASEPTIFGRCKRSTYQSAFDILSRGPAPKSSDDPC
jgi:hypothetical protein